MHREAIGDTWDSPQQIAEWSFRSLARGWAEAIATFRALVDYPIEFLTLYLSTLRVGTFLDNTPLNPSNWKEACRSPSELLVVQSVCDRCSTLRSFASRTMLTAPTNFPRWVCAHFGLECTKRETPPDICNSPRSVVIRTEGAFESFDSLTRINRFAAVVSHGHASRPYFVGFSH